MADVALLTSAAEELSVDTFNPEKVRASNCPGIITVLRHRYTRVFAQINPAVAK